MGNLANYLLDAFTKLLDRNLSELASIFAIIGFSLFGIIKFTIKILKICYSFLLCLQKYKDDLYPFFDSNEIDNALKYYINTKCQNVSPSNEKEPSETHAFATKEEILPFFIDKVFKTTNFDNRFFIILADSGMGKTTFLFSLFRSYKRKWIKHFNIHLLPFGYHSVDNEIDKIDEDKREITILLLDAYDEDLKATRGDKERLNNILKKIERFRIVVITCRTQFFLNEHEEPYGTGLLKFGTERGEHIFHKLYISPFDDKDIKKYLQKKYKFLNKKKRKKAFEIVNKAPYLMVRPMLLSNIDDFLNLDNQLSLTTDIYEVMVNKWVEREANRTPRVHRAEYKEKLIKFTKDIAIDIYNNEEKRGGLFIEADEIKKYVDRSDLDLSVLELKSRSLLNRDSIGRYKFSHKSILEYQLAKHCFENECKINANNASMGLFNLFLHELYINKQLLPNISQINSGEYEIENLKHNNKIIRKNIRELRYDLNNIHKILSFKIDLVDTSDISFLSMFSRLQRLELNFVKLDSFRPVTQLTKLEHVKIVVNDVFDLSTIGEMNNLKKLSINCIKMLNMQKLSNLKNLVDLRLPYIPNDIIEYLSPLTNLTKISFFKLSKNEYNAYHLILSVIIDNIDLKIKEVMPTLIKIISLHPQYDINKTIPSKVLHVTLPEIVEDDIIAFKTVSDQIPDLCGFAYKKGEPLSETIDENYLNDICDMITKWNYLYFRIENVIIEFKDTIEHRLHKMQSNHY